MKADNSSRLRAYALQCRRNSDEEAAFNLDRSNTMMEKFAEFCASNNKEAVAQGIRNYLHDAQWNVRTWPANVVVNNSVTLQADNITANDFNALANEMRNHTRTIFGIKQSNSDMYENMRSFTAEIQSLRQQGVSLENIEKMDELYINLQQACETYLEKHPNPRTDAGKQRREYADRLYRAVLDVSPAANFMKDNPELSVQGTWDTIAPFHARTKVSVNEGLTPEERNARSKALPADRAARRETLKASHAEQTRSQTEQRQAQIGPSPAVRR